MKLLSLFVLLLLWNIPGVRSYLQKITLLRHCVDFIEKKSERIQWFLTDFGMLAIVFIVSIVLSLADSFLGPMLQFIEQAILLLLAISSLQQMSFSKIFPENQPEVITNPLFDQLPESIWQMNYYWIAPLFSYLFFGVFGLVFYWMLAYFQQKKAQATRSAFARTLLESTAWLPARVLAFAYIIVGNFSAGLKFMGEYLSAGTQYNQYILLRAVYLTIEKESITEGQQSAY
jgi:hypothetical protein